MLDLARSPLSLSPISSSLPRRPVACVFGRSRGSLLTAGLLALATMALLAAPATALVADFD